MTKQIKLAVLLPHYQSKTSSEHCRMWMQFGAVLNESAERFSLVVSGHIDECGIDRARNKCMEHARKADADWLLMLDSDTWVTDGGDLLQMISDADHQNLTIVGAAVPRRNLGGERTLMVYDAPADGELVSLTPTMILGRAGGIKGGRLGVNFAEVDALATACIAINMRHAEFMDQPFFRFTETESEDIDFCRRVREMRGGWMLVDDFGKPSPNGVKEAWQGLIAVDNRIDAMHLNKPVVLRNGLV